MNFFDVFANVFFVMAMIYVVLGCSYLHFLLGAKRKLQPVHYISYKKNHFDEKFEFVCEFCGGVVSSGDEKCPACGGNFGKNREYLAKKRAIHQKYLTYMKDQEDAIEKEEDYINNTIRAIQRRKLVRHQYYNFEIGEPPVYTPAADYEFTCEYCDNKLRGKSTDETGCGNCGASYKDNLELLVREEEDRLEKRHYDEYVKLKELEVAQNIRNEQRDARVDEKYGTSIRFMEKNGKYIAIVIILGIMVISAGITFLILKFR